MIIMNKNYAKFYGNDKNANKIKLLQEIYFKK